MFFSALDKDRKGPRMLMAETVGGTSRDDDDDNDDGEEADDETSLMSPKSESQGDKGLRLRKSKSKDKT